MKKLLAVFLAAAMIAAVIAVPVTALADDEPAVPDDVPATVVCESVTANNESGNKVTVDIKYTGTELISSARFKVKCDIPYDDIYSDINVEYNPQEGLVIVWADNGESFGACTLCTVSFVITNKYDNGTYPITVEMVDATAASAMPTVLKSSDGELIINRDFLMGDVDFDGDVDNTDLILVARYIVKIVEFTPRQIEVGDMDHSGEVTNTDLITIAKIIVGLV